MQRCLHSPSGVADISIPKISSLASAIPLSALDRVHPVHLPSTTALMRKPVEGGHEYKADQN
jgi:hypothetical protein